jgi:hypothetical protein
MKNIILVLLFFAGTTAIAQVGINTENPKTTLQIQKNPNLNYPDGLILPRISGDSLRLKDNAFGLDQNGAMLFVTSPMTTSSLKTQNVIRSGIYVYDAFSPMPILPKEFGKKWRNLRMEMRVICTR